LPEKRLILIVINPAAGKSSYKKKLGILKKTLYDEEIEYELFFTEHGNIGQLASIIKQDPSITEIFVMGGDGTLNYVVNEI
jgi:diacylglycerol kinase family enzyme